MKREYILIIALIFIVIGLFIHYSVLPSYKLKVQDAFLIDVAKSQTISGNIFYINNNTLDTITIKELCGVG